MIERKPSEAALARAVNLSPASPSNTRENSADVFCDGLGLGDKICNTRPKEFEREIKRSNERGKFATDLCGKFNGEPFKTAAENVKFERETRAKTPALPQIKFDLNTNLNRVKNLTNQAVRAANQGRVNLTSSERSETDVKFSFKFNQKALK